MSTPFWVGLPLQVFSAAVITFRVFDNDWKTFVISASMQLTVWTLLGRKGWI